MNESIYKSIPTKAIDENNLFLDHRIDWANQIPDEFLDLRNLLLECDTPNDSKLHNGKKLTVFPDFIGKTGFIEIFCITSGTYKKKNKSGGMKLIEEESIQFNKHFGKNRTERIIETTIDRPESTNNIENLRDSIKYHFNDHLDSLKQYNGNKHISCFLMLSDDILNIKAAQSNNYDGSLDNTIDWLNETIRGYLLWYDIKILEYLKQYIGIIDYVVYYNRVANNLHFIKLTDIPEIIKEFHSNSGIKYIIYPIGYTQNQISVKDIVILDREKNQT